MGIFLSRIFVFLILIVVGSHAASPLPPQVYWNSVLPKAPMPRALSELLVQPDLAGPPKNFAGFNPHAFEDALLVYYNHAVAASDMYRLEDPTRVVYFLEKAVRPGTTMKYSFSRNTTQSKFLPREIAESIPFSSSKLPEILNRFSVKPGSFGADTMKTTLQTCDGPVLSGENKYCATSLESMVDYCTTMLGRNIQAISTEVEKGADLQNYTITPGVEHLTDADRHKLIVCHRLTYAYAVFYCHAFGRTRVYSVSLQGSDGTKAKAVVVCHVDTSEWNPKTYAFLQVKVEPGTDPICHFLPEGHIAWVTNQKPT